MNKLFLFVILCLLLPVWGQAQQLPLFTQYRQNIGLINPASLSADFLTYQQSTSLAISYRRQWIGLQSAPTTQFIQGSHIINNNGMGLVAGGYLLNDQTGPTGFTGLYGRVGVIFSDDVAERGISVGLNVGMVQYRVNISEIEFLEANDILITEDQTQLYPDVGFGVYAYQRIDNGGFLDDSQIYGGISIPQMIGLDLEFKDANDQFFIRRVQHFYGIAGLIKYLDDDRFLEPSIWVRYTPQAKVSVDANIRYKMASNFWIGTGGSSSKAVHLEAGLLIGEEPGDDNTFTLGYGFDYHFTSFGPDIGSTHEVNISYSF